MPGGLVEMEPLVSPDNREVVEIMPGVVPVTVPLVRQVLTVAQAEMAGEGGMEQMVNQAPKLLMERWYHLLRLLLTPLPSQ